MTPKVLDIAARVALRAALARRTMSNAAAGALVLAAEARRGVRMVQALWG